MQQGPMTAHFLLDGLGRANRTDDVVARLTNRSGAGWANVLERGGTFASETWTLQASEASPRGWGCASASGLVDVARRAHQHSRCCHAGRRGTRTAWARLQGRCEPRRGPVTVKWRRSETGTLTVAVDLPVNVQARVSLPVSAQSKHSATGPGLPRAMGGDGSRALYAVGSGHSDFAVEP